MFKIPDHEAMLAVVAEYDKIIASPESFTYGDLIAITRTSLDHSIAMQEACAEMHALGLVPDAGDVLIGVSLGMRGIDADGRGLFGVARHDDSYATGVVASLIPTTTLISRPR